MPHPPSTRGPHPCGYAEIRRYVVVLAFAVVLCSVVLPHHMCHAWRVGPINATIYAKDRYINQNTLGTSWTSLKDIAVVDDIDGNGSDDLAISDGAYTGVVVLGMNGNSITGQKVTLVRAAAHMSTQFGRSIYPLRYDYNGDGTKDIVVSASHPSQFSSGFLLIYSIKTDFSASELVKQYTSADFCPTCSGAADGQITPFAHHVLVVRLVSTWCIVAPSGANNYQAARNFWPAQCGITKDVPLADPHGHPLTAYTVFQPEWYSYDWLNAKRKTIVVLGDLNDDGTEELGCIGFGPAANQWGTAYLEVVFQDRTTSSSFQYLGCTGWGCLDSSTLGAPGDINGDGVPDVSTFISSRIFFNYLTCSSDSATQASSCGFFSPKNVPSDADSPSVVDGLPQNHGFAVAFARRQPLTSLYMWYIALGGTGVNAASVTGLDVGNGVPWNTDTPSCKYHRTLDVNPWTQWNLFALNSNSESSSISGIVEGRVGVVGSISLVSGAKVFTRAPDASERGPRYPLNDLLDGRWQWAVSATGDFSCTQAEVKHGVEGNGLLTFDSCSASGISIVLSTGGSIVGHLTGSSVYEFAATKAASLSYDLNKVKAYFTALSVDLAALSETTKVDGSPIYALTADPLDNSKHTMTVTMNARVNVINFATPDTTLATVNKIVLVGKGSGVLIINKLGDVASIPNGLVVEDSTGNGINARVLLNLPTSTGNTVLAGNAQVSILAPNAKLTLSGGDWSGSYIGKVIKVTGATVVYAPFGSYARKTNGWSSYQVKTGCNGQVNMYTAGVASATKWMCAWGTI